MTIQQHDYREREHHCSLCFISVKISVTNIDRHDEGGLCMCMNACVFISDRRTECEISRSPGEDLYGQCDRDEARRGGRAGPKTTPAHDSRTAPCFLTAPCLQGRCMLFSEFVLMQYVCVCVHVCVCVRARVCVCVCVCKNC